MVFISNWTLSPEFKKYANFSLIGNELYSFEIYNSYNKILMEPKEFGCAKQFVLEIIEIIIAQHPKQCMNAVLSIWSILILISLRKQQVHG